MRGATRVSLTRKIAVAEPQTMPDFMNINAPLVSACKISRSLRHVSLIVPNVATFEDAVGAPTKICPTSETGIRWVVIFC